MMPESCDLHQDVVAAGFEIELDVDGSTHQVAALAAHNVVFFALFLKAEFEDKGVFASEAFEVAWVELRMSAGWILSICLPRRNSPVKVLSPRGSPGLL